MAARLVRRADARPVVGCQPVGHRVARGRGRRRGRLATSAGCRRRNVRLRGQPRTEQTARNAGDEEAHEFTPGKVAVQDGTCGCIAEGCVPATGSRDLRGLSSHSRSSIPWSIESHARDGRRVLLITLRPKAPAALAPSLKRRSSARGEICALDKSKETAATVAGRLAAGQLAPALLGRRDFRVGP